VDATLTDLLTARPDPRHRAYTDLAAALNEVVPPAQPSPLDEAVALIGAAHEHAGYSEFAEARLLLLAGRRLLRQLEPVRIPPHRAPSQPMAVTSARVG
jgi:hypothetical protein